MTHPAASPESASCTGKIRYAAQHAATAAYRSIRKRKRTPDCFGVYRCHYCHGWHLGNSPSRRAQTRQRRRNHG